MIRNIALGILFACLVLLVDKPAFANGVPGDGFDVVSYQLALTPDIGNKALAGRQFITLRATRDGIKQLSFTGNALIIDSALLDGVAVEHSSEAGVLNFELAKPLARGRKVKLELSYHGTPARGFVASTSMLYTSYFACDWMVCVQDVFGDKAEFSLDLNVPSTMDTLSVGRMISKQSNQQGMTVHRWKAPRPYSAYLYGFAVGQFHRSSDKLGSAKLIYLSDVADGDELKKRFARTKDMANFLSAKVGVPLPVAEYSQLLVSGSEAQEAATYSVIGIDVLVTKDDKSEEDWAIVHELSHQWWGNLITCQTLDDFWLNEGITSFMVAAWKEHRYGRDAYEAELKVAKARLEKARAKGFDKPLAWSGVYPNLGTRRAVQYSKGALFMAHLRTTLGEAAFWSGLRQYTRTHAGGTVTSVDLQRAMEAASGQDLNPLFVEWVYGDASLPVAN
jgi:aminopeptidase N